LEDRLKVAGVPVLAEAEAGLGQAAERRLEEDDVLSARVGVVVSAGSVRKGSERE
jgi:hypothetical protein